MFTIYKYSLRNLGKICLLKKIQIQNRFEFMKKTEREKREEEKKRKAGRSQPDSADPASRAGPPTASAAQPNRRNSRSILTQSSDRDPMATLTPEPSLSLSLPVSHHAGPICQATSASSTFARRTRVHAPERPRPRLRPPPTRNHSCAHLLFNPRTRSPFCPKPRRPSPLGRPAMEPHIPRHHSHCRRSNSGDTHHLPTSHRHSAHLPDILTWSYASRNPMYTDDRAIPSLRAQLR